MTALNSALYTGRVRHRRFAPKTHAFEYEMVYFYLDLAEVERLFRHPFVFSKDAFALLSFRRKDYLGDETKPLDHAVRDLVRERTGKELSGPIRLLTQVSYLGHCFNPVSFYYCFDAEGAHIEFIVAHVTNTPWKEKHAYVVECPKNKVLEFRVPKSFHVSPFMPMDIEYGWRFTAPGPVLSVHMENRDLASGATIFDATMTFKRQDLTLVCVLKAVAAFPLMTAKTLLAIYFQALRMKLKSFRFYSNPSTGE